MTGGVLWLGLVAPVLATRHVFEARTPGYFAVTAGYPLVGEVVMGAIVGTWHGKARR